MATGLSGVNCTLFPLVASAPPQPPSAFFTATFGAIVIALEITFSLVAPSFSFVWLKLRLVLNFNQLRELLSRFRRTDPRLKSDPMDTPSCFRYSPEK